MRESDKYIKGCTYTNVHNVHNVHVGCGTRVLWVKTISLSLIRTKIIVAQGIPPPRGRAIPHLSSTYTLYFQVSRNLKNPPGSATDI